MQAAKSEGRVKELFRKYGKIAVGTHLAIYAVTFSGLYVAIENKFDPKDLLIKYGLLSKQEVTDEANPQQRGWFTNLLTGPSSSLALAFLCNKALMPVRAPITIGLTPMVARVLQQRAATASSVAGPAAASAASKASAKPIQKTGVPQKAGPASSPTS